MATPPDFAVGQVLTSAHMDAVGLWLVKSQTIGSGVPNVEVTGAFSSDFDAYKIVVSGGAASASGPLSLKLGSTTSGYYGGYAPEWTSFTPTFNNVTIGNGTRSGAYLRAFENVFVRADLVFGSTTTVTGNVTMNHPLGNSDPTPVGVGVGRYLDTGTRHFGGYFQITQFGIDLYHTESGNGGIVNATNPFTWTTNDTIHVQYQYQALTLATSAAWSHAGYGSTDTLSMNVELNNPNLAERTAMSAGYTNLTTTAGLSSVPVTGFVNNATQYTAFTIAPASGTLTGGTIRVYGYRN